VNAPIRRITAQDRGPTALRLTDDGLYRAVWQTLGEALDPAITYRVRVLASGGEVGRVDVRIIGSGGDEPERAEHVVLLDTAAIYTFIGSAPRTTWLPSRIETDARGFLRTGRDLVRSPYWTREREPFLLETSHPGVFAAGDVRSGSNKRVASAVGEGAMAVNFGHEYLAEI
jgi:NADPH-dependent glutamate synthase beta subunit-like oxidoreductase